MMVSGSGVRQVSCFLLRGFGGLCGTVLEAEAVVPSFKNVTAMGETVEQGSRHLRVAEGVPRIADDTCPFCAQNLRTSPVIAHCQAYFSETYAALKAAIASQDKAIGSVHGGDIPAAFERQVRVAVQTHEFWAAFTALPPIDLDTAEVARAGKAAREGVLAALRAKGTARP
jgi:wobble nucleotide-excising tRNase